MRKSQKFTNIKTLLKFFLNDSLHGVLDQPFFKNRITLTIFLMFVGMAYIAYFLLNMSALGTMMNSVKVASKSSMITATRITISSFLNMSIVFGIIIYTFIRSTINYSRASIFVGTTIPFLKKEVIFAQKLFKGLIGLVVFEIIFIIVVPIAKLMVLSVPQVLLFIVSVHAVFFVTFYLIDLLYQGVLKISNKLMMFFDFVSIIFAISYMMLFRFKVDVVISKLDLSITVLLLIATFIPLLALSLILYIDGCLGVESKVNIQSKYMGFKLFNLRLNLDTTFNAMVRTKNFWYITGFEALIVVFTFFNYRLEEVSSVLGLFLPIFGIVGLYYADSTFEIRSFFNLFRISVKGEFLSLILMGFFILSPSILLALVTQGNYQGLIYGGVIYLSSLIAGFLFPKSKGNLNETASALFLMILLMTFTLAFRYEFMAMPIILVLMGALYLLAKKERRVY